MANPKMFCLEIQDNGNVHLWRISAHGAEARADGENERPESWDNVGRFESIDGAVEALKAFAGSSMTSCFDVSHYSARGREVFKHLLDGTESRVCPCRDEAQANQLANNLNASLPATQAYFRQQSGQAIEGR